jgi:pyruvate/2-oxoglutarate dehydrogenase complex dihydrolipoamide dehydrogenase (E3) component
MAEQLTPEICVIGGGPGGIAAALAAVAEGAPVVLVEKGTPGGANLAWGSVPSKALIAAADLNEALRLGPVLGVTAAPLQVNLGKVRDHLDAATAAVAARFATERLTALGIKVVEGSAVFTDRRTVAVADFIIRARRFILAVGSLPAVPDLPGLKTIDYATFVDAFDLSRRPAHLLILGAGRHALEYAQGCNRLGIDATVIDEGAALPEDDPELAEIVIERLRAEGVRLRTGAAIRSLVRRRGGIRVTLADPAEGESVVDGSHLLVATGRSPNVEGLGLAAAGVLHDASGIKVDRYLRTANRHIYAVGDAVAGPALVGRAEDQAARVVRSIVFRRPVADDPSATPAATFTDPALASVGLSEAEARARHKDIRVLRFPFVDNDRAAIERLPAGTIKVLTTASGQILGAAIVGRGAAELIAPWSLAIANRLPISALADLAMPYPTRSGTARRVAAGLPQPGLTPPWRRRIIELLRRLG